MEKVWKMHFFCCLNVIIQGNDWHDRIEVKNAKNGITCNFPIIYV